MLDGFDAAAADAIVRAAAMDGTAPLLSVEVKHLEGALGRPDPNGGVLSHFEAPYVMYSVAMAPSPAAVPAIDGRIADDPRRRRAVALAQHVLQLRRSETRTRARSTRAGTTSGSSRFGRRSIRTACSAPSTRSTDRPEGRWGSWPLPLLPIRRPRLVLGEEAVEGAPRVAQHGLGRLDLGGGARVGDLARRREHLVRRGRGAPSSSLVALAGDRGPRRRRCGGLLAAGVGELVDALAGLGRGLADEILVLELLQRRVHRPGARPPDAAGPLGELLDDLVAVHRLLGEASRAATPSCSAAAARRPRRWPPPACRSRSCRG